MSLDLAALMTDIKKPTIHVNEWPLFVESIVFGTQLRGTFVEIGVKKAKSTACIYQVLGKLGQKRSVYSIDILEDSEKWWWERQKFKGGCDTHFILGSSHSLYIQKRVPDNISWLFIDGCHCYDCVSNDIAGWCSKVVTGGIVIFHDTSVAYRKTNFCYSSEKQRLRKVKKAIKDSGRFDGSEFVLVKSIERGLTGKAIPGVHIYRRK